MALTPGTKLGPYEILSAAGAGGMGEVYRAKDTRLDRTVAIKVLPEHLSANPEAKQRFEREARAISSLNQPNLCTLFDIGAQDGVDYLVMEYMEGESLATRLSKGPLPIQQVLKIGIEICEGLEKAHASGITHRDLKPGNIMLTKSGAKLMDFGLAKIGSAINQPSSGMSATLSSPVGGQPLTAQGSMVGTFQYMSPEQVEGKEADARSDIFALGAVLYEMATGKRAFEGKTPASVIAAVLEREPAPISSIQPMSPIPLDALVKTCMAKDAGERWQTAHDVKLQLKQMQMMGSQSDMATVTAPRRKHKEMLAWSVAGVMALLAISALVYSYINSHKTGQVFRAQLTAPNKLQFNFVGEFGGPPVLSPDGTKLIYSAFDSGKKQLYLQSTDSLTIQPIQGTEDGFYPFWSPDSHSIGFFAGGKLNRLDLNGGSPTPLADATFPRGGSWGRSGEIIFSPQYGSGIWMVSANGGTAKEIIPVDTKTYDTNRWAWYLPDGKHFLYLAANHSAPSGPNTGVFFASTDGKENRKILQTLANAIFASDHILFLRGNTLMAQSFDPLSGQLKGEPVAVTDKVDRDSAPWHGSFTASENGTLIHALNIGVEGRLLQWFDRSGKMLETVDKPDQYLQVRISPDGKKFATTIGNANSSVWIYDLAKKNWSKMTFGTNVNGYGNPVWSPDGTQLAFNGNGTSGTDIVILSKLVSGAGEEKLILDKDPGGALYTAQTLLDWSPDNKTLLYVRAEYNQYSSRSKEESYQLNLLPLTGDKKPSLYLKLQNLTSDGVISPDGRWIAYTTSQSGKNELFVSPLPWNGAKWQVSTTGAANPHWRKDGKELYYDVPGFAQIMTVEVDGHGPTFSVSATHELFRGHNIFNGYNNSWSVTPDGQRFLLITNGDSNNQPPLTVIQNWTGLLQKK